jgi:imidazoleglycerol phosphate dehydratase HisB
MVAFTKDPVLDKLISIIIERSGVDFRSIRDARLSGRDVLEKAGSLLGKEIQKKFKKSKNARGFGNFVSFDDGNIASVAFAFEGRMERQPLKIMIGERNAPVEDFVNEKLVHFLDQFCFSSKCEMQIYLKTSETAERMIGNLGKCIGESISISLGGKE